MRAQYRLIPALLLSLVAVPLLASAEQKEVNVAYLRAAINTISDREAVVLVATYLPDPGLVEAQGRNERRKGFARFSVKDLKTGTVFTSMYCAQDSAAFKDLIAVTKPTAFRFSCTKDYGESNEPGIFVKSVESYTETATGEGAPAAAAPSEARYRVTLVDNVTSNRTVLADVALGQSYSAGGVTVRIEPEDKH